MKISKKLKEVKRLHPDCEFVDKWVDNLKILGYALVYTEVVTG